MKILALLSDAFGADGGIARFNRELIDALAAMPEVECVDVLCRHPARRQEPLPPKVAQASAGGGRAGYAALALWQVLASKHDLVLCGHLHLAPLAATAAAIRRAPLWVQLHGIEAWQRPGPLRARAVERATLVTAVSRYTRRRFLEWAALEPHRVRVLPNTVEPRFAPGPRHAKLAERLGLHGKRALLTVGRLAAAEQYKGHERVIRALPQLAPDVCYLVVGDGDDRGRLEALAREQGVGARVVFAGRVAHEELVEFYRLADAFVMPSSGEGFGIVYLEAAACALPVLGSREAGAVDALADGAIGAFAPADAEGLVEALRAVLSGAPPDPRRVERFARERFARHVGGLLGAFA
ncbi:MAG: glycosyltransferase family 4 protein [Nevskiaceae bacterium]